MNNLSKDETRVAYEAKEGLLWVDFMESTEEDGRFLEQTFKFHHLAVEDCMSTLVHPPKINDFRDYLFFVVHGINYMAESDIVETAELDIFLGAHLVVTNHNLHLYCIDEVKRLVEDDGRPMKHGADFLAHAIVDAMVDNIVPTIDKMSDITEQIEEEVIHNPHQAILEAIMKLKRSTLRIHRVITPQREVLNRLYRGDFPIIREEAKIFYRDIYDHLVRVADLNQAIRDRVDNALNTYLSSMANRQNEVMKVLSIIAAIFLPLSLVAGIYGMNFKNMPELSVPWAYFAVLAFVGIVIFCVIWWFWAKRWLTWGRRQFMWTKSFVIEMEKLRGHFDKRTKRPTGKYN